MQNYALLMVVAAAALLPGCQTAKLAVSDSYMMRGAESLLLARVERRQIGDNPGLPRQTVRFFAGEKLLGEARTDAAGEARLMCTLPDGTTEFRVEVPIGDETLAASGLVFNWSPDRTVIFCDIDGTISETDFSTLVFGDADEDESRPFPHAAETLRELTKRFELIYLTARPVTLRDKTRRWLAQHGFPPAPLITTPRRRDVLRAQGYKMEVIREIQAAVHSVGIGIGNAVTDAEAYAERGLLTVIIDDGDDSKFRAHAVIVRDWPMLRRLFDANREVLENPERLHAAIASEEMIRRPLIRYRPK